MTFEFSFYLTISAENVKKQEVQEKKKKKSVVVVELLVSCEILCVLRVLCVVWLSGVCG